MGNSFKKSIKSLCIYLLRGNRDTFDGYIKGKYEVDSVDIKPEFGLDGKIFYPSTHSAPPRWKQDVDDLAASTISVDDNCSNKAVLITRINSSVMAVTFGYGRSLLNEEDIVRNFGLKVALSIIDPKKIRSVNTATFEDIVVSTQHQASNHTSQSEFDLDTIGSIFRGVTGIPSDENYGRSLSGKDMLKATVSMDISELKSKLLAYDEAYRSNRYQTNDFGWIDNICEVRDAVLAEGLDGILIDKLKDIHKIEDVVISPPENINWESVSGIFIKGAGKEMSIPTHSIDIKDYISNARSVNIGKLKRDKLMVCNDDGNTYSASSVYASLVTHVEYDDTQYILCMGNWYEIENGFYKRVAKYIDNIPRDDTLLPVCTFSKEADYNEYTANHNDEFCLMDKVPFWPEDAPSHIEACDIFSKNKKFIHVKFKTHSSLLSHLFAQGRVSYQSFVSDQKYKQDLIDKINGKFGTSVLNADDDIEGYEVVYAIVTKKSSDKLSKVIPFFSAVTLMQTAKALSSMGVKYSVCVVKQEL